MGHWVGVEMSDHLTSFNPKEKKKDAAERRRKARKTAKASRRRNR